MRQERERRGEERGRKGGERRREGKGKEGKGSKGKRQAAWILSDTIVLGWDETICKYCFIPVFQRERNSQFYFRYQ